MKYLSGIVINVFIQFFFTFVCFSARTSWARRSRRKIKRRRRNWDYRWGICNIIHHQSPIFITIIIKFNHHHHHHQYHYSKKVRLHWKSPKNSLYPLIVSTLTITIDTITLTTLIIVLPRARTQMGVCQTETSCQRRKIGPGNLYLVRLAPGGFWWVEYLFKDSRAYRTRTEQRFWWGPKNVHVPERVWVVKEIILNKMDSFEYLFDFRSAWSSFFPYLPSSSTSSTPPGDKHAFTKLTFYWALWRKKSIHLRFRQIKLVQRMKAKREESSRKRDWSSSRIDSLHFCGCRRKKRKKVQPQWILLKMVLNLVS